MVDNNRVDQLKDYIDQAFNDEVSTWPELAYDPPILTVSELEEAEVTVTWRVPADTAPGVEYFDVLLTGANAEIVSNVRYPKSTRDVTFTNLPADTKFLVTVVTALTLPSGADIDQEDYVLTVSVGVVTAKAVVVTPPVDPPTPTPLVTWKSGAFTSHDPARLHSFATMRNRPLDFAVVFPTRDKGIDGISARWYIDAAGDAPRICVGVPFATEGGSIAQDLTKPFTQMIKDLKADGRPVILRFAWEMNLPQWAHKVTDGNLAQWRSRWNQYYDQWKNGLQDQATVWFNPNFGANQSGLTGSIERAWVDGKVDAAGPDAYDCWPAYLGDSDVAYHWSCVQGWQFWIDLCKRKNVPLVVPEWGVSSGSQWAGHCGNDNPRYITEMYNVFKKAKEQGVAIAGESYFDEPASYVASSLIDQNPNSRARYRSIWDVNAHA